MLSRQDLLSPMDEPYRYTFFSPLFIPQLVVYALLSLLPFVLGPVSLSFTIYYILGVLALLAVTSAMSTIQITVDRERVTWSFGFGLMKKRFLIKNIKHVEIVKNTHMSWTLDRPVERWGYGVSVR